MPITHEFAHFGSAYTHYLSSIRVIMRISRVNIHGDRHRSGHSDGMHAALIGRRFAPAVRRFSRVFSSSEDIFYSSSRFHDVIEHQGLAKVLEEGGFVNMSKSQDLSYGPLCRGESVVLAAETGSGKTLAYLVPLIERILKERDGREKGAKREKDEVPRGEDGDSGGEDGRIAVRASMKESALIFCPNAMLCEQVVKVVHDVFQGSDIKCAYVSSQRVTYDYSQEGFPDVVVTTPIALHSLMTGVGPIIGPEWTFDGLKEWARYVVFDEADLLLGGSYGKKIGHVMDTLRGGDRERAAYRACDELGIDIEKYWSMPRHIRKAAQLHGGKGMLDAGIQELTEVVGDVRPSEVWLRQYVFVAATMPQEGRETVGQKIIDEFPHITWINGGQLHKTLKNIDFRWIDTSPNDVINVLSQVIMDDIENETHEKKSRIIVFSKDTASSKMVTGRLNACFEDTGVSIVSYHKGMDKETRSNALQALCSGESSIILVCTDATARGLDVPNVSHVVHADFPASAVDFLHRSGRTGRAGERGIVTSLVQSESRDLADAIKELMCEDDTMEGAFSRNRSFRKKHKKYGRFVKRGQVG
jgi:superfamily II DNA/RNA helicase